ncbi:MAG: MBL fold metallo-hydrolase [Candidatus Bathyarchaeia archaeon]
MLKYLNVIVIVVGPLDTNCYIVYCQGGDESAVIDPGFSRDYELNLIMNRLEKLGLRLKYIINTHGHPDHVSGNTPLKSRTHASVLIHHLDRKMLSEPETLVSLYSPEPSIADTELYGGETIQIGGCCLKVLHTPGHTKGSITLLGEEVAFTGDTLFAGSIGRVDLPSSSPQDMEVTLKEKILDLPDNLEVYPGHGPKTMMGVEKRVNPYLVNLKRGKRLFPL